MGFYILTICIVIFLIVAVYFIVKYRNSNIDVMSFRETMDIVGLPIVTFRNNGNKYNFLLDTGASQSVINSEILNQIHYCNTNMIGEVYGMEGNTVSANIVYIELNYKGKDYSDDFKCVDMSAAFGMLKKEYGVTIHGILSSRFFEKYKYVLDFKDLIAYSKK